MKTIEEAAKENYPECDNRKEENKFREALRCGFYAGVEFAQRWISVDDELPKEMEIVLVKVVGTNPKMQYIQYISQSKVFYETSFVCFNFIKKWDVLVRFERDEAFCIYKDYRISHWRPIELK